jgi:carbon-monoxide dehydrogenase small subunit
MDGRPVRSCLTLAIEVQGEEITTIEGMAPNAEELHPIQESFIQKGAIQCGYCTPGMIMSTAYLLNKNPNPTEQEIRAGLSGNLCRCTGYNKIVDAIQDAAEKLGEDR